MFRERKPALPACAIPGKYRNGDIRTITTIFHSYLPNLHLIKFFSNRWWIMKNNRYSAGIDFSRQNLTSVDVGF